MRLYREKFIDKKGRNRKIPRWYIDFVDNRGRRHRMPALSDKDRSLTMGQNIEALVACRIAGLRPDAAIERWLDGLPDRVMRNLVAWELVSGLRAQAGKLLDEHIRDWRQSLIASGCSPAHVKTVVPRVERIVQECGFRTAAEIDPSKVERFLMRLRDHGETVSLKRINRKTGRPATRHKRISRVTYNYFVRAIRQFCKWLVETGRADRNPVATLKKVAVTDADTKRPARTLTVDEVRRLVQATITAEDYRGIPGRERALIYVLANESGLRANELRQLRVSDFDVAACTMTVRSGTSKNKKAAVLPLKPATAAWLAEHLQGKAPGSQALHVPAQPHLMIQADLERAGIPYRTEDGTAHFHGQRHNFATALDAAARSMKTCQNLMRHSDPRLTLNIYTHGVAEAERAAVNALPDLYPTPERKAERA